MQLNAAQVAIVMGSSPHRMNILILYFHVSILLLVTLIFN